VKEQVSILEFAGPAKGQGYSTSMLSRALPVTARALLPGYNVANALELVSIWLRRKSFAANAAERVHSRQHVRNATDPASTSKSISINQGLHIGTKELMCSAQHS
jgi:hypothetical protein